MNSSKAIFYMRDGVGGEIAECRNCLVDLVLEYAREHKTSHILWVDDDVLSLRGLTLVQLLGHDRDIASGVYFCKYPGKGSQPLIFKGPSEGGDTFIPNRAYETWGTGMGLCLIKLDVYKRMMTELELGEDKYGKPRWYHTGEALEDRGEIEKGIVSLGCTEDLYFYSQAHKLGYKPLVDTTKHAFGFHYDAKLDKGYPEEQWDQWINQQPITWKLPDGSTVVWD